MWEALAAIGSIASAAVIAITVVMAARQVKITADQLEQTRRATQFEAVRSVLRELAEPKFVSAFRFIVNDLASHMRDETFFRAVGQIGLSDLAVHEEIYLLRALDRIGTYVKFGLVDGEIVYSSYWARIILSWELLHDVVAIHRQIAGTEFWKSAEFLHDDCARWLTANKLGYDASAALARMAAFNSSATQEPAVDTEA
jgi:hypothetical protein